MDCTELREDIANFIRCSAKPAKVTIADYAASWGIARGTMRGYMNSCNINFDHLRACVLHKMANSMLAVTRPIEVCEALGYSEPAAFYRTYRQWTGHSVKEAPQPLKARYYNGH